MTTFEALFSIAQVSIGALSTLAAAFGGAWLAFRFESARRQKERRDEEAENFQRVVFLLGMQLNAIKQFVRDELNPHRGKEHREFWIPAVDFATPLDLFFVEFQGLAPMFRSEYMGFGADAVMGNARAVALADLVSRRQVLHVEEYQRQLRMASPPEDGGRTVEEITSICDGATLQQLKRYTDEMYELSELTLETLDAALGKATEVILSRFKGYEFTVFRRL
ncbi:hypothetical protein [Achromobacter insolitus]|uniref:hypothetical protein n=1 Tax=Achromobacter insolitus TaxID=217204 RepID=UPI0027E03DF3|nr:hypothetical protein [Achromobacter insolitus]MDQ6212349.1 hypothetical protein [Achromobacter insolitus]